MFPRRSRRLAGLPPSASDFSSPQQTLSQPSRKNIATCEFFGILIGAYMIASALTTTLYSF
jgi:hypothetical protein